MGQYLFHYTSRELAQDVCISGRLRPKIGRKVYFTQDTYQTGVEAKKRLAITGKPIEIVCLIPRKRLENVKIYPEGDKPSHAEPEIGSDFADLDVGCGTEWFTYDEIDIKSLIWWSLSVP